MLCYALSALHYDGCSIASMPHGAGALIDIGKYVCIHDVSFELASLTNCTGFDRFPDPVRCYCWTMFAGHSILAT